MTTKQFWTGGTAHERLGPIWVALSETGLVAVRMQASESQTREWLQNHAEGSTIEADAGATEEVLHQLEEYLAGQRRQFQLAIDWSLLTPFQVAVLEQVMAIPYGQTRTYQEIADLLDKPGAARAVGRANATNPMPLVVPCHRVLGADGGLHGYSGPGGVETKAWLLQLEGSRLL